LINGKGMQENEFTVVSLMQSAAARESSSPFCLRLVDLSAHYICETITARQLTPPVRYRYNDPIVVFWAENFALAQSLRVSYHRTWTGN
jgi:hypothetical protein